MRQGKRRMRGFGFAAIVAMPLLLAGCGGSDTPAAGLAPCPRIAILAEGADLTRFRDGAPRDLTAMVVDARIVGFDATCDYAGRDRGAVEVRVTPRFEAERGPAAEGRSVELPWFVAVSDPADSVTLERIASSTQVSFPANVARALASGRPVRFVVRAEEGTRIQQYPVRIAFQLTPDELAFNRQRGAR